MKKNLALRLGLSTAALAQSVLVAPANAQSFQIAGGDTAISGSVEITLTEHGIPHIVGTNYGMLGYGFGYSMARNDLCGTAETFISFRGERARYLGSDSRTQLILRGTEISNVDWDYATKLLIDDANVENEWLALDEHSRMLVRGYAEGYNRYVSDTSSDRTQRPAACRDAEWVKPIDQYDVIRRIRAWAIFLGSGQYYPDLIEARPPSLLAANSSEISHDVKVIGATANNIIASNFGSNAMALGKDLSEQGSAILFGNPHFFWSGPNRFVQAHLTIPGELDTAGVTVIGMPVIIVGFNETLAWSHTVSTDARGTIYQLDLDPSDPTRYIFDGKSIAMEPRHVTTTVTAKDGAIQTAHHEFWMSRFGPIVEAPGLAWDAQHAYALADANRDNHRMVQQWIGIAKSKSVSDLKASLDRWLGLPWLNTIAADNRGEAFYANASVAPATNDNPASACSVSLPKWHGRWISMANGSRSECLWRTVERAPQPGILPASARPFLVRPDYVANSNDSHWLSNAEAPLEGFAGIIGPEQSVRNFRTRQGIQQVRDRISGADGLNGNRFSLDTVKAIFASGRNLFAEMVVGDLVAACRSRPGVTAEGLNVDLTATCKVLSEWDRRDDIDSVGAHIFREFKNELMAHFPETGGEDPGFIREIWKVPFDPKNPVQTPSDLDTDHPAVLQSLALAVRRLEAASLPLESRLGDIQFLERDGKRLAIHGGHVWDSMHLTFVPGKGYTDPVLPSSSYVQAVTFGRHGPVADVILGSSQAPNDEASAYHSDQTEMYSHKEWFRFPFSENDIQKHKVEPTIRMTK